MSAPKSGLEGIRAAVGRLGPGTLTETALRANIFPLFSRVLANREIYLANHSLGRPLDQTCLDVEEAMSLWYEQMDDAWEYWLVERTAFRERIALLINAPAYDCIIPKTSAGQGLRAIVNCFDRTLCVAATCDEFNSIDHILKVYSKRGRINPVWVHAGHNGEYQVDDIMALVDHDTDLLVISMVFFTTGQLLTDLASLITEAHNRGARVLVDLYHAVGVVPVDIQTLDADFAIGGCYKYLRGGPGACWLYIHPRHLDGSLETLDSGWFAQPEPFAFERPDAPGLAGGGDAFLESTPPVLPWYQARAGLEFTYAMGVSRLRAYAVTQLQTLVEMLRKVGIAIEVDLAQRGAFLTVFHPEAAAVSAQLKSRNIVTDAREGVLRICPDLLNTEEDLAVAAEELSGIF